MLIDPREGTQTQVCSRKAGLPIEAFGEEPTAGPVAVELKCHQQGEPFLCQHNLIAERLER